MKTEFDETKYPKINAQILLVEDDRSHQEYVFQILSDLGCHVRIACDGMEALSILKGTQFDLILMDLEMPEMNGLQATKSIQEMYKKGEMQKTPIVAITANHDEGIEKVCLDVGMVSVISKHLWRPKWIASIREELLNLLSETVLLEDFISTEEGESYDSASS